MIIKKTHKRKKVSRMHGRKMGTHGWGARKKHKKSGHRGGTGMAGTGKRGDSKTTLITRQRINLQQIEKNLEKYGKKTAKGWEVNLKKYKILGEGEVKEKLIITAFAASESALKKVQKAGGQIILPEKKKTLEKKEEEE